MSRAATAESRARLVSEAAKLLRQRGPEGASVADICHAAGLTHGGFYKHFGSKEELLAEATAAAFGEVTGRYDRREAAKGADAAAASYVAEYLSAAHLAHPEHGCPVAAFGADAGRRPESLAPAFAEGVEALIARFARVEGCRDKAIRRLLLLVGAAVAARAVGDGALRRELLTAARGDNK
jgi:TetR/AcrR family transcriptional repressor of nem operon